MERIKIILSRSEMAYCAERAIRYQARAEEKGYKERQASKYITRAKLHDIGAKGEAAFARLYGLPLPADTEYDYGVDFSSWTNPADGQAYTVDVKTSYRLSVRNFLSFLSLEDFKAKAAALMILERHDILWFCGMISRSRFLQEYQVVQLGNRRRFAVEDHQLVIPEGTKAPEIPADRLVFEASKEDMIRYKAKWDKISSGG
ncbi:MAG: hypothetical protein ACYTFQ_23715 [Planctomycetota bacterium]